MLPNPVRKQWRKRGQDRYYTFWQRVHGKLLDLDGFGQQSKIELFSLLCYLNMDKVEDK